MNKFTKLSGSALCAALFSGSSGIAAHAQNALTTVSSQNMSEATIVRVGCGVGDPFFIESSITASATQGSLFTMPNMIGLLAGFTFFTLAVRMLPEPARGKCIKILKNTGKCLVHLNTCCSIGAGGLSGFDTIRQTMLIATLISLGLSLWLSRRFWTELLMVVTGRHIHVQPPETAAPECEAAENAVRRVVKHRTLPSVLREAMRDTTPVKAHAITVSDALPVVTPAPTISTSAPSAPQAEIADQPCYDRSDPTPEELAYFVAALDRAFANDSCPNKTEDKAQLVCHSR